MKTETKMPDFLKITQPVHGRAKLLPLPPTVGLWLSDSFPLTDFPAPTANNLSLIPRPFLFLTPIFQCFPYHEEWNVSFFSIAYEAQLNDLTSPFRLGLMSYLFSPHKLHLTTPTCPPVDKHTAEGSMPYSHWPDTLESILYWEEIT